MSQQGQGGPEKGQGTTNASEPGGLPAEVAKAERIARELLDKLSTGKLSAASLADAGLSRAEIESFLRAVERARATIAASRGGASSAPPTFADFQREMEKALKPGNGGQATGAASKGEGSGTLRGAAEGWKENVDLEYQDLLEEYYRSLADPALRKRGK